MSWQSAKILQILVLGPSYTDRHLPPLFPVFMWSIFTMHTRWNFIQPTFQPFFRTEQTLLVSLPRIKGPALLALLPDIPGLCSLLALPDVSPPPLSDERRLDILELYRRINLISTWDKDSQVKGKVHASDWGKKPKVNWTEDMYYSSINKSVFLKLVIHV